MRKYSFENLDVWQRASRLVCNVNTNRNKKVIYSEFFWQTNSRRMGERMVLPFEVIQRRSRQPKTLLKGEF